MKPVFELVGLLSGSCWSFLGVNRLTVLWHPASVVSVKVVHLSQLRQMSLHKQLHLTTAHQQTGCLYTRQHQQWLKSKSWAGCLGLSPVISAQFTLEKCVAASNREKFTKKSPFLRSRSFNVIDVGTTGKLVGSACYDKQQVLCLSATVLMVDELIAVK